MKNIDKEAMGRGYIEMGEINLKIEAEFMATESVTFLEGEKKYGGIK